MTIFHKVMCKENIKWWWTKYLRNMNKMRYLVSGAGNGTDSMVRQTTAAGNVGFFFFSQTLINCF